MPVPGEDDELEDAGPAPRDTLLALGLAVLGLALAGDAHRRAQRGRGMDGRPAS